MRKPVLIILMLVPFMMACSGAKEQAGIESFRYELHNSGETAVFYTHKADSSASLYYRLPGSMEGWHISSVDPSILSGIGDIVKKHKLMKCEGGDMDSEDKGRDRRVIMISYRDGRGKDILDYAGISPEGSDLDREILSFFTGFLGESGPEGFTCPKTRLEYDKNGKIISRTSYEY